MQRADWLSGLVTQAKRGERSAFDRLAIHYRPLLFTLAFVRTGDAHEAEDIVQDVLAQAWRRISTLDNPCAFSTWVRTIATHACNHWYRKGLRNAVFTQSWDDTVLPVSDSSPLPLALLLNRERQRELRRALSALPEANRQALLLHIWGGYSYEEIATLTAVSASTIEGRIYRAKRQLRRLLQDEGAMLFHSPSRRGNYTIDSKTNGDKIMTIPSNTVSLPATTPEDILQCVLFVDRFSRLIDSGVSLVRSLQALEDMPSPYGPVAAILKEKIMAGANLSDSMRERPDLFSPVFIALIRAGEVGGVLEEALERARRIMRREWELARRRPATETPTFFTLPSAPSRPDRWADLTEYQRLITLLLFCETFSMMLASGTPILNVMDVVAELLPTQVQGDMKVARQAMRDGVAPVTALAPIGIFPRFLRELIEIGTASGSLDRTLYSAAETLENELHCRFPE